MRTKQTFMILPMSMLSSFTCFMVRGIPKTNVDYHFIIFIWCLFQQSVQCPLNTCTFFFFFAYTSFGKDFHGILHVYQLQFPWSLTGRVGDFNSRNWAVSNHTLCVSTSFFRSLSYSPYISSVWAAEASSAQSFLTQELFPASDHSYCLFLNLI